MPLLSKSSRRRHKSERAAQSIHGLPNSGMMPYTGVMPHPGMMTIPIPGMIPQRMMMPSALGLDSLENENYVFIKQKIELLEIWTGFETNNQYDIFGPQGYLFHAQETSSCCTRNCLGSTRPFDIEIRDISGTESMTVSSKGLFIGKVNENWSWCYPSFSIKDEADQNVLKIKGPCSTESCCGSDVVFKVYSADGLVEIGRIAKKWSGFIQEAFTDADNFGVYFNENMTVKLKAILIAATMLIDFMYFEDKQS